MCLVYKNVLQYIYICINVFMYTSYICICIETCMWEKQMMVSTYIIYLKIKRYTQVRNVLIWMIYIYIYILILMIFHDTSICLNLWNYMKYLDMWTMNMTFHDISDVHISIYVKHIFLGMIISISKHSHL